MELPHWTTTENHRKTTEKPRELRENFHKKVSPAQCSRAATDNDCQLPFFQLCNYRLVAFYYLSKVSMLQHIPLPPHPLFLLLLELGICKIHKCHYVPDESLFGIMLASTCIPRKVIYCTFTKCWRPSRSFCRNACWCLQRSPSGSSSNDRPLANILNEEARCVPFRLIVIA